jgi:hypothetical protein
MHNDTGQMVMLAELLLSCNELSLLSACFYCLSMLVSIIPLCLLLWHIYGPLYVVSRYL